MNITSKSKTWTSKDSFNMVSASSLQDAKRDEPFTVDACVVGEDVDRESGEVKPTACLKTATGVMYSTISEVVVQQIASLIELVDAEPVKVKVVSRKNKSGNREYLMLQLC